jgi:hypothetical protein
MSITRRSGEAFDNKGIVDLLMGISFYCAVVRFLGAVRIDIEENNEQSLREFPLRGCASIRCSNDAYRAPLYAISQARPRGPSCADADGDNR